MAVSSEAKIVDKYSIDFGILYSRVCENRIEFMDVRRLIIYQAESQTTNLTLTEDSNRYSRLVLV